MRKSTHIPRILLVEDNATLRELYEEILRNKGFAVTTSVDGLDAYQKIRTENYDLVLLDVMLPHMDGIQILEKVPAERVAAANIVLLTNLAQKEMIEKSIAFGARGYLIKSHYNPKEFTEEIKKFLT